MGFWGRAKRFFSLATVMGVIAMGMALPAFGAPEPGIISSTQTGMPEQLWIDESASRMSRLMPSTDYARWPAINRQFMIVSLSQSEPELALVPHQRLGAARLNYLWNVGAIDAAEVLARLYEWDSDIIRKEVENIALLSTRPERYCQGLVAGNYEEIETGMLIYCYARFDRISDATALYEEQKGEMDFERRALLARFLDLNEDDPLRDQPWIELPMPFEFVLDEAIGRPRGLKELPPAYAYFSRESGATPRTDLEIVEGLVQLGALPHSVLFAAYRAEGENADSYARGRVEAVQALDALDFNSDDADIKAAIVEGWDSFSENHMEQLYAIEAQTVLGFYDPFDFEDPELQELFVKTAVMGGWSEEAWVELIPHDEPELMLGFLLRHPQMDVSPNQLFTNSDFANVVKAAFFGDEINPLEANAFGEAIWQSLYIIDAFDDYSDAQVAGAFMSLRISGLDDEARNIAIALLLDKHIL